MGINVFTWLGSMALMTAFASASSHASQIVAHGATVLQHFLCTSNLSQRPSSSHSIVAGLQEYHVVHCEIYAF